MIRLVSTTVLLFFVNAFLFGQKVSASKSEVILSAIKGTASKNDTIVITSGSNRSIGAVSISGEHSSFFKLVSPSPKRITIYKA